VIDDTIPLPERNSSPAAWGPGKSYVPTFCVFEFLADTRKFMKDALDDPRFRESLSDPVVDRYLSEEYARQYEERYPNIRFVRSHLGILRTNMKRLLDAHTNVAMGTDMWALPGIGAHLE